MPQQQSLFNPRILRNLVTAARWEGVTLPPTARSIIANWADRLASGGIDKLTESQVEQTFNNQIFCRLLGYQQIGEASEASLMPKTTGLTGRDTPDFVLGKFDPAANLDQRLKDEQ